MKKKIITGGIVIIALIALFFVFFNTKGENYKQIGNAEIIVTNKEEVIYKGKHEIYENSNALSLLKSTKLKITCTGAGDFSYVSEINGIKEGETGGYSGWMFKVNGVDAVKGAGQTPVKNGDKVEWYYGTIE